MVSRTENNDPEGEKQDAATTEEKRTERRKRYTMIRTRGSRIAPRTGKRKRIGTRERAKVDCEGWG